MDAVAIPHIGIHPPDDEFQALKAHIQVAGMECLDEPYRRFVGDEYEQETFFIEDPNGNILEVKSMVNPELMFKEDLKDVASGCMVVAAGAQEAECIGNT